MNSTVLFYGPGAREKAVSEAHRQGRLMVPPIGDDGLRVSMHPKTKVPGARDALKVLSTPPPGLQIGFVVIGPMDLATKEASDALLKTVEEPLDLCRIILWAHDVGSVSPTIRSRCLAEWVSSTEVKEDDDLEGDGYTAVDAALNRRFWLLPSLVGKYTKEKRASEFLGAVASAVVGRGTEEALTLWERVRKVAKYRNPSHLEIVAALLPED